MSHGLPGARRRVARRCRELAVTLVLALPLPAAAASSAAVDSTRAGADTSPTRVVAAPTNPDTTRATARQALADTTKRVAHHDSLAAAVEADTSHGGGPYVPGLRLRLGDGYARVRSATLVPTDAPEAAPDERVLSGPLRFFGVDGTGRLTFGRGGLRQVGIEVKPIVAHQRDYIDDQLTRAGYHRRWLRRADPLRECEWDGATKLVVHTDSLLLRATVSRVGESGTIAGRRTPEEIERDRIAAELRPYLTDPTPILEDTLTIDPAATPGRHETPTLIHGVPPVYDDALQKRGVAGIVRVLALVGLDGRVVYARAIDGPPELFPVGESTARGYRFGSYRDAGKPVRFWVWIPIRFGV